MSKHTCPCCGYIVFDDPAGSFDICPICFWEDDAVQVADPWYAGGANQPSLVDSQQNFRRFGAMEERFIGDVRKPTSADRKDPRWRLVQPTDKDSSRNSEKVRNDDTGGSYYYWLRRGA